MRKFNTPAEDGDRSQMLRRMAGARPPSLTCRASGSDGAAERDRDPAGTSVLRAALNDCKALKVNPAAGIELRVPKRKPIVWTLSAWTRWRTAAAGGGAR